MVEKYGDRLNSTILKASHHGSKYSNCDEFTEAVNPEIMIFQTGKNNYGHPDETLIEKCTEKGIMVYRNDLDGAIGIADNGKSLNVVSMRKDSIQNGRSSAKK